jgi:uncharacterized protein (DUF58 family)
VDIKEIEKIVAKIKSNLFKNSNSFSVGMLKSHFKGAGLQFKEHQVYNTGDDVRFIDWKLSAKSNNIYVKTFEEERNVEIIVVLDLTETLLIGYEGKSKLEAMIEIVCLLMLLSEKSKDKIKIVLWSNKNIIFPPSSGQAGIVRLISYLQNLGVLLINGKPSFDYDYFRENNEVNRFSMLKSFIAKKKQVIFLSDFSSLQNENLLNSLLIRKNMHCFRVVSPVDVAQKKPFSILTKQNRNRKMIMSYSETIRISMNRRGSMIKILSVIKLYKYIICWSLCFIIPNYSNCISYNINCTSYLGRKVLFIKG